MRKEELYIIVAYGQDGDIVCVSDDNDWTYWGNARTFNSRKEAEDWIKSDEAKCWGGFNLTVHDYFENFEF